MADYRERPILTRDEARKIAAEVNAELRARHKTTPAAPATPSDPMRSPSSPRRWGAAAYLYFGVPTFAVAFVVGLVRFA